MLSFAQQQLWLVDQINPGTAAYNVPYPILIRGALNFEALQASLTEIVARHEAIRTLFLNYKGRPLPVLPKQWEIPIVRTDLQHIANADREAELRRLLKTEGARPFNLASDVKLRATLHQIGKHEYVFHHVSHHISWDLRSKIVFYQELGVLYEAFCAGKPSPLPELPIQYGDYAVWQRSLFEHNLSEQLTSFWVTNLSGAPPYIEMPTDFPRPSTQSFRGAKHAIRLSAKLLEDVRLRCVDCKVTYYMMLLAAFKILLFCYTGQEDIVIGSPFAARPPKTEKLIGVFVNTLVVRSKVHETLTFREVMTRVRDATLAALAHQDLPFEKIVEVVRPPRDPSRNALFQINFRVQGNALVQLNLLGLDTQMLAAADNDCSKFDLAVEMPSSADSVGFFEYNTSLFERSTIECMAQHFDELLHELVAHSDVPLHSVHSFKKMRRQFEERRVPALHVV